jgi:hypothetical protein
MNRFIHECGICWRELIGNNNILITACNHRFHANCFISNIHETNVFNCFICNNNLMVEDAHNTTIVNNTNIVNTITNNIIVDDILDEESMDSNIIAYAAIEEDINDTMIYNNELDYDMDSFERLKIG